MERITRTKTCIAAAGIGICLAALVFIALERRQPPHDLQEQLQSLAKRFQTSRFTYHAHGELSIQSADRNESEVLRALLGVRLATPYYAGKVNVGPKEQGDQHVARELIVKASRSSVRPTVIESEYELQFDPTTELLIWKESESDQRQYRGRDGYEVLRTDCVILLPGLMQDGLIHHLRSAELTFEGYERINARRCYKVRLKLHPQAHAWERWYIDAETGNPVVIEEPISWLDPKPGHPGAELINRIEIEEWEWK